MPVSILYSGDDVSLRSICKQYAVADNDNDYEKHVSMIRTKLEILYMFYGETGEDLEFDVYFQY